MIVQQFFCWCERGRTCTCASGGTPPRSDWSLTNDESSFRNSPERWPRATTSIHSRSAAELLSHVPVLSRLSRLVVATRPTFGAACGLGNALTRLCQAGTNPAGYAAEGMLSREGSNLHDRVQSSVGYHYPTGQDPDTAIQFPGPDRGYENPATNRGAAPTPRLPLPGGCTIAGFAIPRPVGMPSSGSRIRTCDLQLMRLASWPLLYPAMSPPKTLSAMSGGTAGLLPPVVYTSGHHPAGRTPFLVGWGSVLTTKSWCRYGCTQVRNSRGIPDRAVRPRPHPSAIR